MSSSSNVTRPIPLRTSVGAIWEMIPPAPIHSTLLFEKISWSKPGIFRCRSSAPGIAFPRSLIDVLDPVNTGGMVFHSFSVDFKLEVLIEPHESHIAVTAEDRHQGEVSGFLQT